MTGLRWMGTSRVMLRTRKARRTGDAGAGLRAIARGHDRAVGLRIRDQHIVLLLDPDLIADLLVGQAAHTVKGPGLQLTRPLLGNGLLTSEGASHTRARRLVAPAFSPSRLASYVELFGGCSDDHLGRWRDGAQVDIRQEMAALTLDIVGRTLLGIDLSTTDHPARASLDAALDRFNRTGGAGAGLFGRTRQPSPLEDVTLEPVHRLIDEIIDQRRADPTAQRGDVVAALLTPSAEADGLTADEIHDNVMTLMMAGHETTANALSFALLLLGRHPDVQQRLHAEVDTLAGRRPTFEDLPGLTYTRAVITKPSGSTRRRGSSDDVQPRDSACRISTFHPTRSSSRALCCSITTRRCSTGRNTSSQIGGWATAGPPSQRIATYHSVPDRDPASASSSRGPRLSLSSSPSLNGGLCRPTPPHRSRCDTKSHSDRRTDRC